MPNNSYCVKKALNIINIDEINITLDNINKKNVFDYDKELKKKEILFKKIENDN